MSLEKLESDAITFLQETVGKFKNPAIMCSFGKDSVVVLDLARKALGNLPVIFHREPFFPAKYKYANDLIIKWNLTVYDYVPHKTAIQQKGDDVEIVGYYDVGGERYAGLPTGICAPEEGEETICGLYDVYLKPKGRFAYPWDCCIHGHKSCDVDPFHGPVELLSDVGLNITCSTPIFPIRNWSHANVWEYIEKHNIPIHHDRYEQDLNGEWYEKADKRLNPDYFPACVACMKRDGGKVFCPRLNCETSNVADQLTWVEPTKTIYVK